MNISLVLCLTIVALAILLPNRTLRHSTVLRLFFSAGAILLSVRYLLWRWQLEIPTSFSLASQIYCCIYLVLETLNLVNSNITTFWLSRTINRSVTVNQHKHSLLLTAPVDVFIPTYNEGAEILKRTLLGATHITHPDLRVWVLDDGDRPFVKELAEDIGCLYISRVKGKHAKAGNINNALEKAMSFGRPPEFIVVFDADFIAYSRFLERVLPLFEDRSVGIVQTPQHFFNKDPVQINLLSENSWPDEQRFFFNYLLSSKDSFGCAFCCGTGATFRTEALLRAQGMATATVTEDMLTSFALREIGYKTIFLNERLSLGLAPEGIVEYISQRCRWALGAVQQLHTRWAPWGAAPVGWANRLSALDTSLFWLVFFPFKFMLIFAPIIYWWFGTLAFNATLSDLIFYMGPMWVVNLFFLSVYSGKTIIPILGEVNLLVIAPSICRTVVQGLFRPFGRPFKVTAKGMTTSGTVIHWSIMWPFLTGLILLLLGLVMAIDPFGWEGTRPTPLAVLWTLMSLLILAATCAVCVEPAQRRKHERFLSHEPVILTTDRNETIHARLENISLSGARIHYDREFSGEILSVTLPHHDITIPARYVRHYAQEVFGVRFQKDSPLRRRLIIILYTGHYATDDLSVSVLGTIEGWARKLFS